MDFFNRTLVYYIMLAFGIALCFISTLHLVYNRPASLNQGWYICLVIIETLIIIYVLMYRCITRHRLAEAEQLMKELDSFIGTEHSARDGMKLILKTARLLPDNKIDDLAAALECDINIKVQQLATEQQDRMSQTLNAVDVLRNKGKELLAANQKLEEINKLLYEQVKDLSRKLNYIDEI